ncbi:DUF397 domain-containing protein [Streptomyces sp. SID3343]|uniref:DUF397 domain-containing protein n=1 Tax=Streptomyces sp. SID3343 TaxID=2690260 RepID=UPI00136959CF|nr:DUF397 domain-containing protein [Streptomyces sp. SID3343]MYW00971.1 DUF397 domain-containing protein [Streptomyces sp. SID3343]
MTVHSENCRDLAWRTSSYSTHDGECVEVAVRTGAIVARDSKVADCPVLSFGMVQWDGFLDTLHVRRDI